MHPDLEANWIVRAGSYTIRAYLSMFIQNARLEVESRVKVFFWGEPYTPLSGYNELRYLKTTFRYDVRRYGLADFLTDHSPSYVYVTIRILQNRLQRLAGRTSYTRWLWSRFPERCH